MEMTVEGGRGSERKETEEQGVIWKEDRKIQERTEGEGLAGKGEVEGKGKDTGRKPRRKVHENICYY